jgi:murein DD-endopeptidase MepM/ murein hydrolase activator NlpD
VVTQSRRSALALVVVGFFFLWALALDPSAGANPPAAVPLRPAPLGADAAPVPAPKPMQIFRAQEGDTLMGLLQQAGVNAAPAQAAIDALKTNWDPRGLQIGQEIAVRLDEDGLEELRLSPDLHSNLILKRGEDGGFDTASVPRKLTRVPVRVAGSVSSSLAEAASNAGMPANVLAELIEAFSYDVDFQREIQPGDRFVVLYDRLVDGASGRTVGTSDIIYAAMELSGHRLQLYRYTPPGGEPDFYTADGSSVRKALLRTPVDGARISSTFGVRHHPILGYTRMHKGVDFAVPKGTPIMAAGAGIVAMARREGGYGNIVVLRNAGPYSTAYAHMSRFAKGIRPGVHVHQGEVIGYVGATGLATGPHLHYEVRIDDRPVNPLSVHLPAAHKLKGQQLVAFRAEEAMVAERLAALRSSGAVASR